MRLTSLIIMAIPVMMGTHQMDGQCPLKVPWLKGICHAASSNLRVINIQRNTAAITMKEMPMVMQNHQMRGPCPLKVP